MATMFDPLVLNEIDRIYSRRWG